MKCYPKRVGRSVSEKDMFCILEKQEIQEVSQIMGRSRMWAFQGRTGSESHVLLFPVKRVCIYKRKFLFVASSFSVKKSIRGKGWCSCKILLFLLWIFRWQSCLPFLLSIRYHCSSVAISKSASQHMHMSHALNTRPITITNVQKFCAACIVWRITFESRHWILWRQRTGRRRFVKKIWCFKA